MEIGEFGVGRPDFGGRWPRGEALGQKKRVTGLGMTSVDLHHARGMTDRQKKVTARGLSNSEASGWN